MKHSAIAIAAAAAAAVATATSSVALSAASDRSVPYKGLASSSSGKNKMMGSGSRRGMKRNEEFAPRFDGLRFIESLVTAHR